MAVTPDAKRFFQASKHQVPPFRVNSHPSVQNRSTFQLIYHLLREERRRGARFQTVSCGRSRHRSQHMVVTRGMRTLR